MPMIDVVYPRIVDIHTATCLNSGTANTVWNGLINPVTMCFYCFLLFGNLWRCPLLFRNLSVHSRVQPCVAVFHFSYFPEMLLVFGTLRDFPTLLTFQFLALAQAPLAATSLKNFPTLRLFGF